MADEDKKKEEKKAEKEEESKQEEVAVEETKEEKKEEKVEKPKEEKKEEKKEEPKKEEPKEKPAKEEEPSKEDKPKELPSGKLGDIIKDIEKLSVIELADLVKALEDRFGVSAAAPMAMAAMPAAGGADAGAAAEEKSTYDVILKSAGSQKIAVIKVVRAVSGLGLKEAKDLVDGAPNPIKEGIATEDAQKLKADLEEAGAEVELK